MGTLHNIVARRADPDPDPGKERWLSNEEGLASIPLSVLGKVSTLSGMTGALYGTEHFLPQVHGEKRHLFLCPDADEQGQALEGVPVGLVRTFQLKRFGEQRLLNFKKLVFSDSKGIALIRHVPEAFMFLGESHQFHVGPAVLLAKRSDVKLDALHLPNEPVRIVLPPTAPLKILVLENDGTPNLQAKDVRLVIDPAAGLDRKSTDFTGQVSFSEHGVMKLQVQDGVTTLPYMGLGLALLAEALDAEPTESTFGFGGGPIRVGSPGELALEPRNVGTDVVGTLLSEGGGPLVGVSVKLSISLRGEVERSGLARNMRTDALG